MEEVAIANQVELTVTMAAMLISKLFVQGLADVCAYCH